MSDIGFRVLTKIERPGQDLVQQFMGIPASNIADCMNRFFCVDTAISMINEKPELMMAGTAFTVRTRTCDNLMVHKALDIAQPGDVIVIDASGDMTSAILGEIMTLIGEIRKLAGFVIDGCIRDYDALRKMDFPVFARGANPKGPYKDGPGDINYPISCGGVTVNPGDIIVGDHDGVVVVPQKQAQIILEEAKKVKEKESKIFEGLSKGIIGDRSWIDKKLLERGCKIQ